MLETVLFYILSAGTVISAIGVVRSRSAIYSVLWLVAAMCFTAGLFLLLKAFLIAAVQVLVYAGAILVLFLFVVMLLDMKAPVAVPKTPGVWLFAVVASLAFFAQTFFVIRQTKVPAAEALQGVPKAIGQVLFGSYVLPFELTSFLLLSAVVSIVVLAKKDVK